MHDALLQELVYQILRGKIEIEYNSGNNILVVELLESKDKYLINLKPEEYTELRLLIALREQRKLSDIF